MTLSEREEGMGGVPGVAQLDAKDAPPATINLNDRVRVTLTAAGVTAMHAEHKQLRIPYRFEPPAAGEVLTFELWRLMQLFGPMIAMGCPLPFTSTELEVMRS